MKPKRVLRAVIGLLIGLVVVMWAVSYHPGVEFKGGVGIRDSGFFSYPRFHAQLGELPLWKTGEYRSTVRGLPPGPLDMKLRVTDSNYAGSSELASLSTRVNVLITDSSGKEVCSASGRLSDAKLRGLAGRLGTGVEWLKCLVLASELSEFADQSLQDIYR